ncbi:uncharacterized protein N7482_003314 [Penicillium canariense]|uniref:Uncharacterized protein n=1 Tax=Penicillium canariense TaxID=189055 RepID=A0A9W9I6Z4_9EURO|nr:uncharacterized protein N7482_003314 [Penicillium canariense]KAJ5167720.1 hypothetical protein N7482_003314 [Penicillium canariense]
MFRRPPNEQDAQAICKTRDCHFLLPGYGRPLDFAPVAKNIYGVESRSMFPSALDDRDIENGYTEQPAQTLREIGMVAFMEQLTDIPQWWKKIHHFGVADQWKNMALNSDADITPNMANWIIDELKYKALIYELSQAVGLYNGDVTKSDSNVPASLLERLRTETTVLEYVDPELHFYHPGSNYKQRDLLAEALYPLVYGKSRILPDKTIRVDEALRHAGQGEVIPLPKETGITREDMVWRVFARADIEVRPYRRHYQILPSDFELGDDDRWHIATYINNLHPEKHRNIYKIIEDAFNCIVPQWNMTMTPLKDMLHSRARIEYHKAEYYPVLQEVLDRSPQMERREAQTEFDERYEKWRLNHFQAIQPDVGNFLPWAVPPSLMSRLPEDLPSPVRIEQGVSLNQDYKDRGLQVITRILGVDLTPEDPNYQTEWHVEGQMVGYSKSVSRTISDLIMPQQNEHICAASFLIFDKDNMEDPFMEFRSIIEVGSLGDVEHEPGDFIWMNQVFGLDNGEPAIQHQGAIKCTLGRTVMFPSTIQHRLTRFELKDKSKPGYVRGLVFYMVDPNIRIISTANIPPQRLDWTLDVKETSEDLQTAMARLALDNKDKRGQMPMSLTEALETRMKVLKEMAEFERYQHVAFESRVVML